MSYNNLFYHIIFRTKKNQKTLSLTHSDELYKYIWGIINRKDCFLFRINGIEDHIHMLVSIHPTIAVADFVRDIKRSSSIMLKMEKGFEKFKGWGGGYCSLSYSINEKEKIYNYSKNQREHHKTVSFKEELEAIVKEAKFDFDQRFWDDV